MSRFHRHSRITPHRLYRAQVARAWGSFGLLLPIAVLAVLPLLLQQVVRWGQSDGAVLVGIPYLPAEEAATAPTAPAAPTARPVPPPAAEPPAPPLLFCTDTSDLPLPEALAEAHLTDPAGELLPEDADDPAEALAALAPPASPAPAVQPKPAAAPPTPHSGTATALSAAVQTPPAYRSNPRPPYPAAMRQRRLTGSVGVRIHISAEGTPTAVDITAPSGHSDFDRTTQSWILQHWRFHPATADGSPIASTVKTRVSFTLE